MEVKPTTQRPTLPGWLLCLCKVASSHNIAFNLYDISAQVDHDAGSEEDKIRAAAKILDLTVRFRRVVWTDFQKVLLPALLKSEAGQFVMVVGVERESIVVVDPGDLRRPQRIESSRFKEPWKGELVTVKRRFSLKDESQPFGLSWFMRRMTERRNILSQIVLGSVVLQLFSLGMPFFSQIIIDKVLVHNSNSALQVLGIGMVALIIFEAIIGIIRANLTANLAHKMDFELAGQAAEHLFHMPLQFFDRFRSGAAAGVMRDVDKIRQCIAGSSLTNILDVVFLGIFIVLMLLYDAYLTAISLVFSSALVLSTVVIHPFSRRQTEEKIRSATEHESLLTEAVAAPLAVKTLCAEGKLARQWRQHFSVHALATKNAAVLTGISFATSQLIQRLAAVAILWVGSKMVMGGDLTMGQLIAFQMLSARIVHPMRIMQIWQDLQSASISTKRLSGILNLPSELVSAGSKDLAKPKLKGNIDFKGVSFRYGHEVVLRDVSFSIAAGKRVGLIGKSGSGKSTIIKLMHRLYPLEAGAILMDGMDCKHIDPYWIRREIGVLSQEPAIFNGTVRENISYTMPGVSLEEVINAAKYAEADEFIGTFENGYDTMIAERGANLSGGQRQRIALARAFLARPQILILDEATSALDYQQEQRILKNLCATFQGCTLIVTTHRLQCIQEMSSILVVDKGRVVEQGSHTELSRIDGVYKSMVKAAESAIPVRPQLVYGHDNHV